MTTSSSAVPQLELNSGGTIPQLGFGVFQIPPEETADAVAEALRVGYRSIDTAAAYENEREVGNAIRASEVDRSELFVTTKLWNSEQGRDSARDAFDESFSKLDIDYLDLYLIHWPLPSQDQYVETWLSLKALRESGRVRHIGVSNFTEEHLERLEEETGVVPAVNQVELHPTLQQRDLREYHREHGILTEAWSPLAQGELLEDETLGAIGEAQGKTVAQVILRWHIQIANVVIPKSATPERIAENFDIFDFELSDEQMESIAGLDEGRRIGPEPTEFSAT